MENRNPIKRDSGKPLYINLSETPKKKKNETIIYEYKRVRVGRRYIMKKVPVIISKPTKVEHSKQAFIKQYSRFQANQNRKERENKVKNYKTKLNERTQQQKEASKQNALIIGMGQTSKYQNEMKEEKTYIETNLPQYNLGELFGCQQEKLYPKQRKSRHDKRRKLDYNNDDEYESIINEYEMVKESSKYVKQVFYKMYNKGKEIGLTKECILVSLYYNNGIYPIQNIGRRAANFEKQMNEDPTFLERIKKEYEEHNENERKRKLALEQYHALEKNIEYLQMVVNKHKDVLINKSILLRKNRQTRPLSTYIKTVPIDGELDRKYKNIKNNVYDNYDSCKEELEYLQNQMKSLVVEKKEELKQILKKKMTKKYIMNSNITKEDLNNWKTYFINKRISIEKEVESIAQEFHFDFDISLPKDIIKNQLDNVTVDEINILNYNSIAYINDVAKDEDYQDWGNELLQQKVLDLEESKQIIFDDIESVLAFKEIQSLYNAIEFETLKSMIRAHLRVPRIMEKRDMFEECILSFNSITKNKYNKIREDIIEIIERVYFNENVVEIGTAYVPSSLVVDEIIKQLQIPEIENQLQSNEIEKTIELMRKPLHDEALKKLIESATTVTRDDIGIEEEELPEDIIEY